MFFQKNRKIFLISSIIAIIVMMVYLINLITSYCSDLLYRSELEKIVRNPLYSNIKIGLTDSINSYIRKDVFMFTKFSKCKWKLDTLVLFNRKFDRAILFVLSSSLNTEYHFDMINQVYAKFQNGRWIYYFAGQQSHSTVHTEELSTNEKVFDYLSEEVKKKALNGYFRFFGENRYDVVDSVELKNQEVLEEHYFNRKLEDYQ